MSIIYNAKGEEKAAVSKVTYEGALGGECKVIATIKSPIPIKWETGDYLFFRGEKFTLRYPSSQKKQARPLSHGEAFVYNDIVFYSALDELTSCEFLDITLEDNKIHYTALPIFSFYCATMQDLADRLQANLDRLYKGDQKWVVIVADGVEIKSQTLSFNSVSCAEVLLTAYEQLGVPYTTKDRTITFGGEVVTIPYAFAYGKGNGLKSIAQTFDSNSTIVTRAHVYGSTKNLPHRYYNKLYYRIVSTGYRQVAYFADSVPDPEYWTPLISESMYLPNLMLPQLTEEGTDYLSASEVYIDNEEGIAKYGIREGSVFFDGSNGNEEIFPTIENITADDLKNAGINTYSEGYIDEIFLAENPTDKGILPESGEIDPETAGVRIKDIGFNFYDYLTTDTLQISMKSGACAGRTFDIVKVDGVRGETNQSPSNPYHLTIKRVIDKDIDVAFPNSTFPISPGDKFVLLGIAMPEELIKVASYKLLEKGTEWLEANSKGAQSFSPEIDAINALKEQAISQNLKEGNILVFSDADLDISKSMTISHITITEGESIEPQYKITLSEEKTISFTQRVTQSVTDKLATNTNSVQNINTLIQAYGNANFLSKRKADKTTHVITFEAGLNIGKYSTGVSGARIDENGNAEVGDIEARGTAKAQQVIADKATDGVVLSSNTFDGTSALTGYGYGIMKEGNSYKMAIDYLTVRKGMTVAELVIQEYKSVGGVLVVSACNGEIDTATQDGDTSYWMINIKDWDKHPQFVSGDIIRCSRWDDATNDYVSYIGIVDASDAEEEGASQHIYVQIVSGNATPQAGDNIVQFGNISDTARQGLIIISTEDGKPNITLYDGLNSADVNMVDKMTARLGNLNGLRKDGKDLSGYGLWTNNLYLGSKAEEIFTEIVNGALDEYKSVVESEFAVTNQGLTSVQRSVTQLIDGSRNLLLSTNQGATGWYSSSVYSVGGVKGEYTTFTREAYSTDNHYELFCFALRPELIQEGKQYLLSFEVYLPEDYDNVGNVAMVTAFASPSFGDVLSYNANERNNQKTQVGSWVKMEYVITANASGAKDDTTSIYISIARADYNKFQYFYIRNLQMLERTSDSTIAVTDDEFLPWRPALEDANNYADTIVNETKETLIQQTNEAIELSATATKQYADGKIDDAKAEIQVTTDSITQSVSDLRTDVDGDIAGLESEIKQTADSISLKVKEFGISNLNYAYGTGTAVELKTLNNILNQTKELYSVTGLSAKDIVSLSFVIRIKDVIFDTQNNSVDARLTFQLDNNFGYRGFGVYLRQSDFDDITADANGYKTLKITAKGIEIPQYIYNSTTEITPDVVGKIVMRLDYIDSNVDEDGNDIGVIEISELKIEKGDECTAWTSRTQDMDTALLDAGIDIGNKQIVATTDKFIIQNKLGQITASVDEDGNLATGTVLCWNTDEATKDATPYLTTLNRKGNGFLEFFYPLPEDNGNSNLAFQIGWDGSSVFRFYKQDGTQAWIAGDYDGFLQDTSAGGFKTITEEKFHDTGTTDLATAKTYVQNTRNLSANITLYKVVTQDANGVTSYYATDKEGDNKVSSGIYTLTGTPQLGIKPSGATGNYYSRTLYVANALTPGVFMQHTHQWEASTSTNTDIITP